MLPVKVFTSILYSRGAHYVDREGTVGRSHRVTIFLKAKIGTSDGKIKLYEIFWPIQLLCYYKWDAEIRSQVRMSRHG